MKVSRNELKDLLGINLNALKQIERRNTLDKRLLDKGYRLTDKHIEGNKTMYELEIYEPKQLINKIYNVSKTNSFIDYFNIRTREEPNTIDEIAIKVDVNKNTIAKWDKMLQDKRIIIRDGYYYFRLDKDIGELFQVSIEEYKSYWRNKAYVSAFNRLQEMYITGDITLTELQLANKEIAVIISTIEGKYYYKIKKYKVNKNSNLYLDTKDLIRGYGE